MGYQLDEGRASVSWEPNPGPQTDFLQTSAFECLYGGSRGGGKTMAVIADMCRQAAPEGILPRVFELHPGIALKDAMTLARKAARTYRAIVFRRTLPELEDFIERAKLWVPQWFPDVRWQEQKKRFVFPSGAIIRFAYLRHKSDWRNYIGHEYQYMAFEELTNFQEEAYVNVIPSCRTSNPYLTCYVRATTNPGGPGHSWVRARFVDAAPWGEVYYDENGLSMQFIPAKVADNPKLIEADPLYVKRLMALPERERRAMLEGDWDAWEGAVFREFSRSLHVISWDQFAKEAGMPKGSKRIPAHWPLFMSFDWGYGAPFSIGWWTVDPHGRLFRVFEWYGCERKADGSPVPNKGLRITDQAIAKGILEREEAWGIQGRVEYRVADPAMFNPRRLGGDIEGPPLSEVYATLGIPLIKGDNNRIAGKQQLHRRLELFQVDAERESPGLFILDTCKDWIRTVPGLPADEHNPEDVDTDAEDHMFDETKYGLMSRMWAPEEPKPEPRWLTKQQGDDRRGWKG